MKEQDKLLLLKDLCARLPYGVKCADFRYDEDGEKVATIDILEAIYPNRQVYKYESLLSIHHISRIKPYLRPMSSMTEEEKKEFDILFNKWHDDELFDYIEEGTEFSIWKHKGISPVVFDWLNKCHFDYRGLIPIGLALEAPEGMYNK